MMRYYLRVEGVNLDNFVYDTQDLSTIRGGGLLLLRAVDEVIPSEMATRKVVLVPVTTGASSGIFLFQSDEPEKISEMVREVLHSDARLKHATFIVDWVEYNDDFALCREALIARNRWQQMMAPSLSVPGTESDRVCTRDLVRPASAAKLRGDRISQSVHARREYGKQQKQSFYSKETGCTDIHYPFAFDFEDIAKAGSSKGNLNNKIAVLYADGNDFGKRQSKECTTTDLQARFDVELKKHRRNFLKSLLKDEVLRGDDWLGRDENRNPVYRMETLLWGGDEFMLVVPAWKGWDTLQIFFNHSKDWKLLDQNVTHAAGLVFCNHRAPIHRIAALVRKLCESAKKVDKSRNLFTYQVLESFDVLPGDFEKFRKGIAPCGKLETLTLDGTAMGVIADQMSVLKGAEFPRRKLLDLARGRLGGNEIKEFFEGLSTEIQGALNELAKHLSSEALWYHIAELWDYMGKGEATPWL